MMRRLFATGGLLSTLLVVGVLVALAIPRHQVSALLCVAVIEFYVWWRRPASSLSLAAETYTSWLPGLAAVILVALSPQLISQILIIVAYAIFRLSAHLGWTNKSQGGTAILMQFISIAAIFSAAQVWRWSAAVVMVLTWGASWLVARNFLLAHDDQNAGLLAGVWALVSAELAWILSWWMIAYLSPGAYVLIPQAALLLVVVAYILGGIYLLHRSSQLSRNRLMEYLLVASVLLVVILLGTKWNGAN